MHGHMSVKKNTVGLSLYELFRKTHTVKIYRSKKTECPMTGRLRGHNEQRLLCQSKTQVVEKYIHTESK
jgi:hypothetical protein